MLMVPVLLQENGEYIKGALELNALAFFMNDDPAIIGDKKQYENAVPGKPTYFFYAIK
jgi:hypothetical protein